MGRAISPRTVGFTAKLNCSQELPPQRLRIFGESRGARQPAAEGLELMVQGGVIRERKSLGPGFEKEIERIVDSHLGNQVDLHHKFTRLLRKNQSCQKIRLRVLLPIKEVLLRRHAQRVAQDASAAMRRGTKPNYLRPQADRPVVTVLRAMVEGDVNGHMRY